MLRYLYQSYAAFNTERGADATSMDAMEFEALCRDAGFLRGATTALTIKGRVGRGGGGRGGRERRADERDPPCRRFVYKCVVYVAAMGGLVCARLGTSLW